jgi:hypothetical protein
MPFNDERFDDMSANKIIEILHEESRGQQRMYFDMQATIGKLDSILSKIKREKLIDDDVTLSEIDNAIQEAEKWYDADEAERYFTGDLA